MQAGQLHDPALIAQRPIPTQAFIAPTAIEWLLICFAQDRQLFREARQLIAAHHFKPHETPLRLLYDAMCISLDRYGGLTYESLASLVDNELRQNQSVVLTDEQKMIIFRRDDHGLIHQICHPTGIGDAATNRNFSRDLLRQFAYERTVVEPLRRVMHPGFNQGIPENLTEFLGVINTQQARLSTLNSVPEFNLTPDIGSQLVSSSTFRKTGIAFIDEVLGGQRVGDANGIIGPTGGGKTTLGVHLAVASAKQCWLEATMSNQPSELVIFVTAEEGGIKLRSRIWSAFFHIPRTKLETMTDWGALTQPGQLAHYELQWQEKQENKLSEIERYEIFSPQLRSSMRMLDLSGSDEFPNAGFGYIPEIVGYLSRYEAKIATVVIDYAGIFCERYMKAKGMDERAYRMLLKTFGDECRQEISARFGCTTWILHQLKGAMGKTSPTKLMHHSDAAESADFANNLVVCGCLGIACPYTGCRRLNWSKVRYKPNEKITPPTLRINDEFAIMDDVSRLFVVSESGQFITNEEQSQIRGMEGVAQRQHVGGPAGLRDTSSPLNPTQRADL